MLSCLRTHIRTSKITESYWLMDFSSATLGIELRNHSFSRTSVTKRWQCFLSSSMMAIHANNCLSCISHVSPMNNQRWLQWFAFAAFTCISCVGYSLGYEVSVPILYWHLCSPEGCSTLNVQLTTYAITPLVSTSFPWGIMITDLCVYQVSISYHDVYTIFMPCPKHCISAA